MVHPFWHSPQCVFQRKNTSSSQIFFFHILPFCLNQSMQNQLLSPAKATGALNKVVTSENDSTILFKIASTFIR